MDVPKPTARARDDRLLGGVAGGLAARWGVPAGRVRLGFVLGTLVTVGLGAVVYAAAWLVLPAEGEDGSPAGRRGIVLLAQACGALLALGTLATVGALATVFGFGWAVVAAAAAVLVGVAALWPRLGPAWALLPVGALVLPSVALALGGFKIEPSFADETVAPARAEDLPDRLRSGLGLLTVDLRDAELPARGTIPLRIDGGVRRTLIALPHDRCVHVEVRQRPMRFAARLANDLARGYTVTTDTGEEPETPGATVFGRVDYDRRVAERGRAPGPTLVIDYRSDGGELLVRDFPDRVDPGSEPWWPGWVIPKEPRPGGDTRRAERRLERWAARQERNAAANARYERLMPGPCAR